MTNNDCVQRAKKCGDTPHHPRYPRRYTFLEPASIMSLHALPCLCISAETVSFPDAPRAAGVAAAEAVLKKAMRQAIVEDGRRPDGRGVGDTRILTGEVRNDGTEEGVLCGNFRKIMCGMRPAVGNCPDSMTPVYV